VSALGGKSLIASLRALQLGEIWEVPEQNRLPRQGLGDELINGDLFGDHSGSPVRVERGISEQVPEKDVVHLVMQDANELLEVAGEHEVRVEQKDQFGAAHGDGH